MVKKKKSAFSWNKEEMRVFLAWGFFLTVSRAFLGPAPALHTPHDAKKPPPEKPGKTVLVSTKNVLVSTCVAR